MENKVEKKVTDLKIYTKEIAEVKLNFTDNEVPKSYDLTNEEIDALSRAAYTSVDVIYNKKWLGFVFFSKILKKLTRIFP